MRRIYITIILLSIAVGSFFIVAGMRMLSQEKEVKTATPPIVKSTGSGDFFPNQPTSLKTSPYKIQPLGKGQFEIILFNKDHEPMNIQVYDVIGNLLVEEVSDQSQIRRRFDLSESKSRLFVVKFGNDKVSTVRKVTTG